MDYFSDPGLFGQQSSNNAHMNRHSDLDTKRTKFLSTQPSSSVVPISYGNMKYENVFLQKEIF